MLYHGQRGRVPWAVNYTTRGSANRGETESYCRVGDTPSPQGSQIILGVCQLLSPLRSWIYRIGIPPDIPYEEICTMGMGTPSTIGILEDQGSIVQCTALAVPRSILTICCGDRCVRPGSRGVLMQDQGEGLRPLAFMSRALKPTEQRYSTYERKLAAIAYCFV